LRQTLRYCPHEHWSIFRIIAQSWREHGSPHHPAARGRRWRWVAGGLALALTAGLGWQLLPAAGSTDIVAATIETGAVERAPFEDYLPIRAAVAPKVTTLVDTLSGGQVEKLLVQDGAWLRRASRSLRWSTPRSSSTC
jgi:hypothetical protein